MTTKTPLLLVHLVLVTTAVGCTAIPNLSPSTEIEFALADRNSVRQRLLRSNNSSTMVVDPRDLIRIRPGDKSRYICNNGKPLMCDRVGATAYCTCPGSW